MGSFKLIFLFLLAVSYLVLAKPFGGEDDGTSGRRSMGLKSRLCRGKAVKPTATRAKVDVQCRKLYPGSQRCARMCRLEKLQVFNKKGVNKKAWKSYAEYSYPTEIIQETELVNKMRGCGDLYEPGTNSSSSPDCKENEKFITCLGTVVDEICAAPANEEASLITIQT